MSFTKWKGKKGKNNFKKSTTVVSNPTQFAILVGNYPPSIGPDAIIQSLTDQTYRVTKIQITPMKGTIFPDLEFSVFFSNQIQLDAVLNINGSYVHNNPIWIVRYPFFYQSYRLFLINIISSSCSDGQADFSNLSQRSMASGNETNILNFNNQNFAEYFFYLLGSESRDKRIFIDTIILNSNQIIDLNIMTKYFIFLPTLRTVFANQNPLTQEPVFAQNPRVVIFYDPINQKKSIEDPRWQNPTKHIKLPPSDAWTRAQFVDLRSQNQTLWNQYQISNGWNQSQNQNNNQIILSQIAPPLPNPMPNQNQNEAGWDTNSGDFGNEANQSFDWSYGGWDSGFSSVSGFSDDSGGGGRRNGRNEGLSNLPDISSAPHPEVQVRVEESDISKEQLASLCAANVIQ